MTPRQDIWDRDWATASRHPFVFELTRNMRNTRPIAERVAAAISALCTDSGVPGPQPIWRNSAGSPRESDIVTAVERLLDDGLTPANIVVLCEDSNLANRLRERSIGAYSFGRWGSRGVPVESISRFKGLDAAAVVLALADNNESGPAPVSFRSGSHVKRPFVRRPRGFSRPMLNADGAGCRSR